MLPFMVVVLSCTAWMGWRARARIGAPYWLDEGISIQTAQYGFREVATARWNPATSTMTGYHALLVIATRIIGSSPTAIHLLSLVGTALGIVALGIVALKLRGPRVAFIAMGLLATNPPTVIEAANARSYAFLPLYFCVTLLVLRSAVSTGVTWRWAAAGVLAGFGLWLHPVAPLATLSMCLPAVMGLRGSDRRWTSGAIRSMAFIGAALATAAPQAWLLIRSDVAGFRWQQSLTPQSFFHVFGAALAPTAISAVLWLIACLGLLELMGIIRRGQRDADPILGRCIASWFVGFPLGFVVVDRIYPLSVERYVLPVVPACALLAAVAIDRLWSLAKRPGRPRDWLAVRVVLAMTASALVAIAAGPRARPYEDWRPLVTQTRNRVAADHAVAFIPSFLRLSWDVNIRAGFNGFDRGTAVLPPGVWGRYSAYGNSSKLPARSVLNSFSRLWIIRWRTQEYRPPEGMRLVSAEVIDHFVFEQWTWDSTPITTNAHG